MLIETEHGELNTPTIQIINTLTAIIALQICNYHLCLLFILYFCAENLMHNPTCIKYDHEKRCMFLQLITIKIKISYTYLIKISYISIPQIFILL